MTHLTEEQLYLLLDAPGPSGDETPPTSAGCPTSTTAPSALRWDPQPSPAHAHGHFSTCPQCQSELDTLHMALTNFRAAATHLAAEGAATGAATHAQPPSSWIAPFTSGKLWAASSAAIATALAVSLFFFHPLHTASSASQSPQQIFATQSSESDEALLDGIQQDLSVSVPPSLSPLAVTPASPSKNK